METEFPQKPQRRRFDYVALDPEILEHVDAAIEQIKEARKGAYLSRKDFIQYRLLKAPRKLSESEVQELAELFYDEVRFLRQALKEAREAQARGEKPATQIGVSQGRKRRSPRAKLKATDAPGSPPIDAAVDTPNQSDNERGSAAREAAS